MSALTQTKKRRIDAFNAFEDWGLPGVLLGYSWGIAGGAL